MNSALDQLLDRLGRRIAGYELMRTAGRLLTTMVAGLALWFTVDYLLVTTLLGGSWWDVAARAGLSGALLWRLGTEARGGLVAELRTRRSPDHLAMRLERLHPDLDGRLISTVQFRRDIAAGQAAKAGSPALVAALDAEAEAEAAALDHRHAWPAGPAWRVAGLAIGAVILGLSLALWQSAIARVFSQRLAFASVVYPTATRITLVRVPAQIGQGDPLTIEVVLDPTSRLPATATALLRGTDGRTSPLVLTRVGDAGNPGLFRGTLSQVVGDLAVTARAGDARWDQAQTVHVQARPAVAGLVLHVQPPAYLGIAASDTTVGDLEVPVGTRVQVRATANRAIARARLSLRGAGTEDAPPTALTLDDAGLVASGGFTVQGDGTWSISVADASGLDSGEPPRWSISAVPDRAPTVLVSFPGRDLEVTRVARWPIRYSATDDYGITALDLCWQILPPGTDVAGPDLPIARQKMPAGKRVLAGEIPFDLTALDLTTGSRISWWLEATDTCQPESHLVQSPKGTMTVIDASVMRERLAQERSELLDRIKTVKERQDEAHEGVESVRKVIKP